MTDELGNEALGDLVEVQGTTFETSSAARDSVSGDGLGDGISTSPTGLSKTEVVVGGNVETTGAAAGGVEINVVIVGVTIVTDNCATWDAGNRRGKAVIKADFKSTGIKGVKIRIQGSVAL
jgi:hypothetical protein